MRISDCSSDVCSSDLERFVRFSKSRFAIISTNLDTIGFQCRLLQVYKVVRTQAFDVSAATTCESEDTLQLGIKRRRTDEESSAPAQRVHQPLIPPDWLISTALEIGRESCREKVCRYV